MLADNILSCMHTTSQFYTHTFPLARTESFHMTVKPRMCSLVSLALAIPPPWAVNRVAIAMIHQALQAPSCLLKTLSFPHLLPTLVVLRRFHTSSGKEGWALAMPLSKHIQCQCSTRPMITNMPTPVLDTGQVQLAPLTREMGTTSIWWTTPSTHSLKRNRWGIS